MGFRFKDVDEPQDAACGYAQALQLLPPQEVLSAGYLYEEYDPAAIETMLHRLSPQACCVTHASRSCAGVATQREPWYGTAHRCAPIEPAALARWATDAPHPALRLPAPNPFIATDFGLVCERPAAEAGAKAAAAEGAAEAGVLPRMVASDPSLVLWHKTDDIFRRPKTNLFIELVAPAAYHAPSSAVLTRPSEPSPNPSPSPSPNLTRTRTRTLTRC